jgi:hypothetical protein
MNRREFLGSMAAAPIILRGVAARSASRTFEVTTKIELEESHDGAIAWVPLPFLMYPQAEVAGVRRDSLDPATF